MRLSRTKLGLCGTSGRNLPAHFFCLIVFAPGICRIGMNTRTKQLLKLLSKSATRPRLGATASRDPAPQAGLLAGSLPATPRIGWREAIEATVAGLGFDLVDIERDDIHRRLVGESRSESSIPAARFR